MKFHQIIIYNLLIIILVVGGCNGRKPAGKNIDIEGSDTTVLAPGQELIEEYTDSVLIARGKKVNGKKEGLWSYWYDNGQMKAEGNYEDDLKHGMWVEWYKDGMIMWKGEWDRGVRNLNQQTGDPKIIFLDSGQETLTMERGHTYHLQIRIPNIPAYYLFVEAKNATIKRENEPDQFICVPGPGKVVEIIIGYYPDPALKDFRNLAGEYEFSIK